jgi:hypothetical protein
MQYPNVLQLETTGACNASCSFCPHAAIPGQQQARMDEWLFRKIVKELTTWPIPPRICPFLTNEPFADARMAAWCEYINLWLPNSELTFFTNGSLFGGKKLGDLANVRNVASVFLSLHHSNQADYEAELGIPWEKTLASIRLFLRWNNREDWAREVRLLRVQDGDAAKDAAFLAFCEQEFPGVPVQLSYRYNWKGDLESPYPAHVLDIICPRHNSMCVLASGRVALCCMDHAGQYALGDANTETLAEIYNGARAVAYRTRTKRESVPCLSCNMCG